METILAAVVGALAKLAEPAVKDAYEALKALLRRKVGASGRAAKSLENLEEDPTSEGRRLTLKEDLAKAALDKDEELVVLSRALLEKVRATSQSDSGVTVTQTVAGSGNVFSGTGDIHVTKSPY